jgi:hypothetical protein
MTAGKVKIRTFVPSLREQKSNLSPGPRPEPLTTPITFDAKGGETEGQTLTFDAKCGETEGQTLAL